MPRKKAPDGSERITITLLPEDLAILKVMSYNMGIVDKSDLIRMCIRGEGERKELFNFKRVGTKKL